MENSSFNQQIEKQFSQSKRRNQVSEASEHSIQLGNTLPHRKDVINAEILRSNLPDKYTDFFIKEMNAMFWANMVKPEYKRDDKLPGTFTREMPVGNVQGFLAAGTETVRTTLEWALLILAKHTEVQRRVYEEILTVCGPNQRPQWRQRASMVFTEATINEIMRWKTISPLNLMRMTTEQTELANATIDKGTHVIANIWAAHFDPNYWTDPDTFNPDRFIEDGQLIKHDQFIPFSMGKLKRIRLLANN